MKIEQVGEIITFEDEHEGCSISLSTFNFNTGCEMNIRIGDDYRDVVLDSLTVSVMIQQLQKIKQLQEND